MKTKNTPGPWKVFRQDKNDRPGIDSENLSVIVYGNKNNEHDFEGIYGDTTEEEMANAKLIAAAPELLEALKQVYDLIDTGVLVRDISNDHNTMDFLNQAKKITDVIILMNESIEKATS